MKVGIIHPILFKSAPTVTKPEIQSTQQRTQINELSSVTPDYSVITPQKYTKLGVDKLSNGLEIHQYKLSNGHRITIVPMEGSPAIVKNYVNVGSLNETDNIKGISHFLEHMAFNGTTGENGYMKLNTGDSFKKIEDLGGWVNASTSYSKTDYINSTPLLEENDLETQIKVMAAMTEDLKLSDEMIEKEKGPVCSEINMIMDNPVSIAYDQSTRTLFNIKSSADDLIGGSVEHIKNLTKEDVKAYYDKYYTPDNMNLVITGDVDPHEVIGLVAKNFKSTKKPQRSVYHERLEPITKTVRKDFSSNKTKSAEIVVSFAGPKLNNVKEHIINDILSRHFIFSECDFENQMDKINASFDYSIEKISSNPNNPEMLSFATDCSEENAELALHTMLKKISTLKAPSEETLENIKKRIKKTLSYATETSQSVNNYVGNAILNNSYDYAINYEKILDEISTDDIQDFIDKYYDVSKAAIIVMHPETTIDKLNENYAKVNNISFKGKPRQPLNMDKISSETLNNNYQASFVKTKNNNVIFCVDFEYDTLNLDINPAARKVLGLMLERGTMKLNKEELAAYEEQNDISANSTLNRSCLSYYGSCDKESLPKAIENLNNKLKYPRLTQEEFDICLEQLNDFVARREVDSESLIDGYRSQYNPYIINNDDYQKALKTVTLDDVKKLHEHIMKNSNGVISMNVPETMPEVKDIAISEFQKLDNIKPYEYKYFNTFKPSLKSEVLTEAKETAQADITQSYRYKREDNLKFKATERLLNILLNSSKEIGLFNTLREKEHLAYSVCSYTDNICIDGLLSCNILTTTDNKEIGEYSYENVQKSIDGFHRQIQALKDSKYTDEDFESAKRSLKASLLEFESSGEKVDAISVAALSKEGSSHYNDFYNVIDTITREDIDALAEKIFSNPPIYSIVASQDTLDTNKEYLENLKKA